MKLTFWLDGKTCSGKTELAKALGNYVFCEPEELTQSMVSVTDTNKIFCEPKKLARSMVSATDTNKNVLKRLADFSGSVFILDDIKDEDVRDRKNVTANNVDDVIRSVFQGSLTRSGIKGKSIKEWIDACALITGEYFDNTESQNARMIYLNVDGFMDEGRNSKALYTLHDNPLWLTNVCGGYIQWFLKKISGDSFEAFLKDKLAGMRDGINIYTGIRNADRLNENCRMIQMAADMVEIYFKEIELPEKFIKIFKQNACNSIKAVCDDTFLLLGGERAMLSIALEAVFSKCKIRKAVYRKEIYGQYKYQQKYFWLFKEDFLWIENYKESLLKHEQEDHEQYNEMPCLIIRESRLMELLHSEIRSMVKENRISQVMADRIEIHLTKKLKQYQVIYKQYRADSKWGRSAADYPVLTHRSLYPCDGSHCREDYEVDFEPVVQLNPQQPYLDILKECKDEIDTDMEDKLEEMEKWGCNGPEEQNIYKVRKAFMNRKSLYKE